MQKISKDKKVVCVTVRDYPADIVKQMKKAGYRVTEVKEKGRGIGE